MGNLEFEAFVADFAERLGRLAHQLTGDHDAALDLLQDVLLTILTKWEKVAAADHRYAYVRRTMVNSHLNGRRHSLRLPTVELLEEPAVPDLTDRLSESDAMWRALDGLSSRQRAVLVLRYYEDLPDEEIARVLRCRRGTVRSLASRALAELRADFEVTHHTERRPS